MLKVVAFPRDANPYQENLYDGMRAGGARVRYAGESHRLAECESAAPAA